MEYAERIIINDNILGGKLIIKGTRISVEFILELLANNWSYEKIIENYPQLTKEDILAALNYATDLLKAEHIFLIPEKVTA
jgi:uncharacterized protein (DUF433 family)